MPAAQLTDEQLLARDTRDVSIGVSAGAGCGKTHVLTSRFLSHLERTPGSNIEPAELRQLIAITFTDAAAREMRSRIRGACYERLEDPKLSEGEHQAWQKLLREIDTARVSTIHAFCTALLRTHAAEAGLDPTFAVMEQGEADVLLQEVINDVLRERLATHDGATLDLAAEFGQLSQLKERVALLVDQRHRPAFQRWLAADGEQATKTTDMVVAWRARYDRERFNMWLGRVVEKVPLADFTRLLALATPSSSNTKFPAAIATLSEILGRLGTNPDRVTEADLAALLENARVQGICKKDDWPSLGEFDKYKKLCEKLRDAVKGGQPPKWDDDVALAAASLSQALLRLAGDVADEYQRCKTQQTKLDFNDQLALTHRLLADPERSSIRDGISSDLRLLLVDEFQDTDPLQVELIKMICGRGFDEGRLFFVGDFKQSIYRFRGAVPPEFLKLRKAVPERGQLQLTENFRSQPGVLHFVNALFHDSFDDYEALVPFRPAATSAPAVEFLWTMPQHAQGQTRGNVEAARRDEANAVARRLRQLMDESSEETPVVDKDSKQARTLRPGDVAILFRALSDVRLYEEALRDQGLEYYLVGGHAFYAQQEVFDVLNLLRAVASAADEISLAGVLRSPFFALADESLFWLVESGGSLNDGLFAESLPPELPADEAPKVVAAARTLRHLRTIKDFVPVATLLNTALDLTGYDAVLVTEFLGERKLANLHKLIEQARSADQNSLDLSEFITQLNEFVTQPPKEPLASTNAEAGDVIQLMTIHRAKGLEFPFVVLPDMNRTPQLDGPNAALDDELGPLVKLPKDENDEEAVTGMTLHVAAERTADLDERKRLLYVACTRAADYLMLSTSIDALDQPKSDWMKLLANHFDLATGGYVASLPNAKGFEQPQVYIAPPATEMKAAGRSRAVDLLRMLDEAHQLAAEGQGIVPNTIAPIAVDRSARRQFSFSRLSGRLVTGSQQTLVGTAGYTPTPIVEPDGFFEPTPDARGLGSLTHDVLARIDFGSTKLDTEISEWCEHLAPQYVVHHAEASATLAAKMIARFAASARGRELAAAKSVYREIEFLLPWPPGDTTSERYIRGYIDCLYEDSAGAWRIVDYKTNDVRAANVERETKKYELQLYVYAIAAEQALGKSPTELVLELLRPGIEHKTAWNDTARQQAITMVNEAIADAPLDGEHLAPSP